MCDLAGEKKLLRKKMRLLRRNIADKKEKSLLLQQALLKESCFLSADMLFVYLPLPDEPETFLLMEEAFAMGKTVAAPRCLTDGEMEFFIVRSMDDLRPGSYGILEPEYSENSIITPTNNTLILVPGMAFDQMGYRLGYGKGYYDRYLGKHPAVTAGLCFYECLSDSLPKGEFDLAVQFLATEQGVKSLK